jgi:hypothetical protein
MKVPHGPTSRAAPVVPVFLSYVLSFVYIGIYWNNHHHMFRLAESIDGAVLWANLHLLFWLSLLPFTTGWMGENHFERWPTMLYGANLLACAIAFTILQTSIIRHCGRQGALRPGGRAATSKARSRRRSTSRHGVRLVPAGVDRHGFLRPRGADLVRPRPTHGTRDPCPRARRG